MQANRFEEQVKEIMGDFSLPPSKPVWQNIESQIRKKKERRRFIIWFFTLFLLLAGGLWIALETNHSTQRSVPGVEALQQAHSRVKGANSTIDNIKIAESRSNKQGAEQNGPVTGQSENNAFKTRRRENLKQQENHPLRTSSENRQVTVADPNAEEQINSVTSSTGTTTTTVWESPSVDSNAQSLAQETVRAEIAPKEEKHDKPSSKIKTRKWQRNFSIEVGGSNYVSSLFRHSEPAADLMAAQNAVATGFYFPRRINSTSPQRISAGPSLSLGLELKRQLHPRISVNGGLQYHYYSTRQKIGGYVNKDTSFNYGGSSVSAAGYYYNDDVKNYTNKFHLIEVALAVEYKVSKRLPLSIIAGESYGHLLKANAINYDRPSNRYYQNKKNLVKDYLHLFSSVQYSWLSKGRLSIQSGPSVQYSFTGLQKENAYGIPHLFSFGLRTTVGF